MINPFLFDRASRTRLAQRRVVDTDGRICYRLRDRSGFVELSMAEWDRIEDWLRETTAPSAKRLRRALHLAVPFALVVLCVYGLVPPFKVLIDWMDRNLWGAGYLVAVCGMPITMIAIHNRTVQRAVDTIEEHLSDEPRCKPPLAAPRRILNFLELVALVVAGPYLALQVIGTISPEALRNTPWAGTQIDPFGLFTITVILTLLFLRRRERLLA